MPVTIEITQSICNIFIIFLPSIPYLNNERQLTMMHRTEQGEPYLPAETPLTYYSDRIKLNILAEFKN